jgi:hypothetical protein
MSFNVVRFSNFKAACWSQDWTPQELAEFYRVEASLVRANIPIVTDRGRSDEGDPWFVFCNANTGEIIVHFARFDGNYVVASPSLDNCARGRDFRALIEAQIASHPLVIPKSADGGKLFIHPAALLIVLVATCFFKLSQTTAAAGELHEAQRLLHEAQPAHPSVGSPSHSDSESQAVVLDERATATVLAAIVTGIAWAQAHDFKLWSIDAALPAKFEVPSQDLSVSTTSVAASPCDAEGDNLFHARSPAAARSIVVTNTGGDPFTASPGYRTLSDPNNHSAAGQALTSFDTSTPVATQTLPAASGSPSSAGSVARSPQSYLLQTETIPISGSTLNSSTVNGSTVNDSTLSSGLPTTAPSTLTDGYVAQFNSGAQTSAQIQASLESAAPPINDRASVAQFVLREFQAAWGVVPSTGVGSQYDNWVARIIADPFTLWDGGGMSQALAGTAQFMAEYGTTSATEAATLAFISKIAASAGVAVGPGALANVGLPVWQVLQNFVQSPKVIAGLEAPIANFQNLLLAGATPGGSIFNLPPPSPALTLSIGVDTPTMGFTSGHGATATAAGSVFNATPASNPPLDVTNTLKAGDVLLATGAAAGDSTLRYTAVDSLLFLTNGPNPTAVTMNGVSTANITSNTIPGVIAGFSGNITGLTTVTASTAIAGNDIFLGASALGLNTSLSDITINSTEHFVAWMTAAALSGGRDTATIHLEGVGSPGLHAIVGLLNASPTDTAGYGSLTVDSEGSGNYLDLNTHNAGGVGDLLTTTAKITVTGRANLETDGSALNIGNLHTFDGVAAAGGFEVFFTGTGAVAATGDAGSTADDTFTFLTTPGGAATFTPASGVTGGGGADNLLVIQADTGAILVAGDAASIKDIQTVENTTTSAADVAGPRSADLAGLGSGTTFDLAGAYSGAFPITVTNVASTQTVEYSAGLASPSDLTLTAATVLGSINFEIRGSTLSALTVAGQGTLEIDSTGPRANVISDVSAVDTNVAISGGTPLTFGFAPPAPFALHSSAGAYLQVGGTIDASADTGGVTVWLGAFGLNSSNSAQMFIAGTGTDLVHVLNFGGDGIDFSTGGIDTVEFQEAHHDPTQLLTDTTHQYNQVLGFNPATDSIDIHNNPAFGLFGAVNFTNGTGPVLTGAATTVLDYTTGALINASTAAINYIDVVTPVNTTPGRATAQGGFNTALGLTGEIKVVGSHEFLLSYYDAQDSEAVFATVHSSLGLIAPGDHVSVVGVVHMTAAQYAAFGAGNLHFT